MLKNDDGKKEADTRKENDWLRGRCSWINYKSERIQAMRIIYGRLDRTRTDLFELCFSYGAP